MNILILGSGGREHSIAWKLAQSPKVSRIFTGPGNAGTADTGTNLPVNPENFGEVKKAVMKNNINLVVVGPEAPLVAGIHDFFINDEFLRNIPVIGPDKSAARLEGSKDFAKAFLTKYKIPTSEYRSFDSTNISEATGFLKTLKPPYVVKADGLAAGKGVVILDDISSAEEELKAMLSGKFGAAGQKVVIEQYLKGVELSAFIVTDGHSYKLLPEAKDYKRVGEGNTGLNTGGMGAVSPVPFADRNFMEKVKVRIIEPTLKGLSAEGILYRGFIFFGLINVDGDPYVIEYNARLGDPESEVIIPRIKSDFYELIEGVVKGDLESRVIDIDDRYVATVMLVSGGYPGSYEKGKTVFGLDLARDCVIFHSGTKLSDNKVITSGGRVLAVSAWGNTIKEAIEGAYKNARRVSFDNMYYRTDIGFDL
ncbi:MAG: phosphoribosylamine--glycine ligase [Bacteroidales bacterium]|nr:phosphoribosylamine--glycine ligase [Bacteroidales bacterium]